jgi:hypothetical protein
MTQATDRRSVYTFPEREPRNGHHADCPYPARPAQHCPVCQGIRKAEPDQEPGQPPALRLIVSCPTCYAPVQSGAACNHCPGGTP